MPTSCEATWPSGARAGRAEGRAHRAEHHLQEAVAHQLLPLGGDHAAHRPSAAARSPRRPRPRGTPAGSARRRRRPHPRSPAASRPAGRPSPPARPGTGRPWCRSSGAPAPGRPRPRRRPPAPRCRRSHCREARAGGRQDRGPGVRGARDDGPAAERCSRAAHGVVAKKCSRANSTDSRRSASRSSLVLQRRVLISTTISPANPTFARWRRNVVGAHRAATGHQVLVLGRAAAVGQVDVAQAVAESLGHRDRVVGGDGGVRQVDGRVGVGLFRGVVARGVHLRCRVATRPATDTCSRRRT